MSALHELLAVEKTKTNAAKRLIQETFAKFGKIEYFQGHLKTLKMLIDSPQNEALEQAATESRELPTTVQETLEYVLAHWAQAEDVIFQINVSNQSAVADLMYEGKVLAPQVPVDELMGLEVRLDELRKVIHAMPTLTASVKWNNDNMSGRKGAWVTANPEITVKTEKVMTPVLLHEATDKHPAQVEKVTTDKTVGSYVVTKISGAATSAQKAEVLSVLDNLMSEVKQARMRANSVESSKRRIGADIAALIMQPFNK